jgi:hypothetical protein
VLTQKILTRLWVCLALDVLGGTALSIAIWYGHAYVLTLVYMWVTRVLYIFIIVNGIRKDKIELANRCADLDPSMERLFDNYKDNHRHRRRRKE